MTNTMCRDGYCDFERKESEIIGSDIGIGNGLLMAGFVILVAALVVSVWYGNSLGVYTNVDIVPLM
jgi:hypothetical protein